VSGYYPQPASVEAQHGVAMRGRRNVSWIGIVAQPRAARPITPRVVVDLDFDAAAAT
jgi:hypothetical protein